MKGCRFLFLERIRFSGDGVGWVVFIFGFFVGIGGFRSKMVEED